MEILNQLGGLVLGSVPTMVFFILLVVAYGVLVRRPLEKTLAERRARTTGAVEQARGAISAAEAETAVYEDKLRAARAEMMAAREQRLKQWQAERDAALRRARAMQRRTRVRAAQAGDRGIPPWWRGSRLKSATAQLSEQILRAVLPAGTNSRRRASDDLSQSSLRGLRLRSLFWRCWCRARCAVAQPLHAQSRGSSAGEQTTPASEAPRRRQKRRTRTTSIALADGGEARRDAGHEAGDGGDCLHGLQLRGAG